MLGKFIAGDFIAIAGERRRFPASNLMIYLLIIPKTLYYLRHLIIGLKAYVDITSANKIYTPKLSMSTLLF
jgi:hypothetical protein